MTKHCTHCLGYGNNDPTLIIYLIAYFAGNVKAMYRTPGFDNLLVTLYTSHSITFMNLSPTEYNN